jgi:hypothetical protein
MHVFQRLKDIYVENTAQCRHKRKGLIFPGPRAPLPPSVNAFKLLYFVSIQYTDIGRLAITPKVQNDRKEEKKDNNTSETHVHR